MSAQSRSAEILGAHQISAEYFFPRPASRRVSNPQIFPDWFVATHRMPISAHVIIGGAPIDTGIADVLCENFEIFYRPRNLVYSSDRV